MAAPARARLNASASAVGTISVLRMRMFIWASWRWSIGEGWGSESVDTDQRGVVALAARGIQAIGGFDADKLLQRIHPLVPEVGALGVVERWLGQRGVDGNDPAIEFAAQRC